MCGIAGLFNLRGPVDETDILEIKRMTSVLRHRGPDDWGLAIGSHFVLGNTRLIITDLSANGHMPFASADRSVWITYNGFISNYRQLIEPNGLAREAPLLSQTDTEVLVRMYQRFGIEFVQKLTGQFAFCLVDRRAQKAFIVRDFFGIRPLFYLRHGEKLYFSSEIKAFLELSCFSDEIDLEAIYHYLSLAYIPDTMTPFKQVKELYGGRLIEIDLAKGEFRENEYYPIRYDPDYSLTEERATTELREIMRDSVKRNLVADVPVGLTLSGGIDSSSMLALARDLGQSRQIHTYSIGMAEKSFDETRYQNIMVDFARPIHHYVRVGPQEVADNLVRQLAYMDEPTGDGAAVPSFLLAEAARRDGIAVMLSGEGGDETFNAYETHVAFKARKLYRAWVPSPLRRLIRSAVSRLPVRLEKLTFDFVARRFAEGAELDTAAAHYYWRHALNGEEKRRLMPSFAPAKPTERFFTDLFAASDFNEDLNKISLIDLKYYFIGDLMVKNDRTFMAHSISGRFPWMDRLLLEYVARIPPNLRIKGLRRRYLEKQAMKPLLPREIYRRKNMGLEMPHALWFFHGLKPLVNEYLTPAAIRRSGVFDPRAVEELLTDHFQQRKDQGRSLWCVLNFLIWHDLFVHRKNYKDYLQAWGGEPRIDFVEEPNFN
ncbi:MAG: asparagine synthase (glutamine-hydrolyzing) [Myxococcales bacterium]|nr:asparagine synthase (glutamine-hydrolyzing) [Myxococcales bacterium]